MKHVLLTTAVRRAIHNGQAAAGFVKFHEDRLGIDLIEASNFCEKANNRAFWKGIALCVYAAIFGVIPLIFAWREWSSIAQVVWLSLFSVGTPLCFILSMSMPAGYYGKWQKLQEFWEILQKTRGIFNLQNDEPWHGSLEGIRSRSHEYLAAELMPVVALQKFKAETAADALKARILEEWKILRQSTLGAEAYDVHFRDAEAKLEAAEQQQSGYTKKLVDGILAAKKTFGMLAATANSKI